ncbi:MAG: Rab family GTPase, partial [Candidatus Kariarchaeaceae archaeon]
MVDDNLSNIKVVIIGQPSVGKTSLRRTYLGEKFRTNYIETIGSDFSFKSIEIEGHDLGLALWDLAGQDRFLSVHPLFYKGSYGCIVVYSVIDRQTFNEIDEWVARFVELNTRNNLPLMVIGNKIDSISDSEDTITLEEHNDLLDKLSERYPGHHVSGFRTSARTGENVEDGFVHFAQMVYEWIMDHSKRELPQLQYDDDIDRNIPGAYALVMNQITGPQILTTDPHNVNDDELIPLYSNSAIKLIASLDFNDVINQGSLISSFPWVHPKGLYHYIAFVLDNKNARGNKELYILGVNVDREYSDAIAGIKGVLDGFLHSTINEFARLIIEDNAQLV